MIRTWDEVCIFEDLREIGSGEAGRGPPLLVEFAAFAPRSGLARGAVEERTISLGSRADGHMDGYGAKIDANGKVIEQGRYEKGKLKTPMSP